MWPHEWSFPFYSQFDMRESEATDDHSYAGLLVANANIKTGVGATTAFMPGCKNDTNLILVNSVNLQILREI